MFDNLFNKKEKPAGQWINGKFIPAPASAPVTELSSNYGFTVAGTNYRMDNVIRLATPMKKWDMSNEQLLAKYPGKKIYRYYFVTEPVQLVLEPTNPQDPNAIMVLINNIHVGYVPSDCCSTVSRYMSTGHISLSAKVSGGEYKIVYNDGQSAVFSDPVSISVYISL